MNAPAAAAALTQAAFNIHLLVEFAPSTTRTQARRRARFTKEELAELAANIKAVGIMQPIVARPHPKPVAPIKYEIIAGERRWLAAAQAGLVDIPTIVRDVQDADRVTLQLTENLQRKTIDQVEEAEGYDELRKDRKINADQVADLMGVSRTTVFNRLKLLDLSPDARKPLDEGKLSPSVALLIARLPDPKMQAKAAKGCLGDYKALSGFDAEDSAYGAPLTYKDAEQYIKEEFTTRIEGTAAINKAKSEGKAVIAGKEAEEIWKRSHAGPAGHIELGEHYWSGGVRKSYAAALGDNPPGMVLIQSPHSGAAVKCLAREKAIAIFKEKKLKLPDELEPRSTGGSPTTTAKPKSPEVAAKERAKKAREEMKEQLEVDIQIAVFKAVRAKSPAKLGKPELLELITKLDDYGYGDRDSELCPRPKSLKNCTERELVRFVIDELYGNGIGDRYENDGTALAAAAKRYGINVARIEKELTEKAEAKLKEIAAPKGSKTIINPKGKWPFPTEGKKKADKK